MFYLLRVLMFMVFGPVILPFYIMWKLLNRTPKATPVKTKRIERTRRR